MPVNTARRKAAVSRDYTAEQFQKFAVSWVPARRCHVKERPNRKKSLPLAAKMCAVLTVRKFEAIYTPALAFTTRVKQSFYNTQYRPTH